MSNTQIVSGAHLGVLRLRELIANVEKQKGAAGTNALALLKRELGVKGGRAKVLEAARLCIANVANW